MPTLILPPRFTPDSIAMSKAPALEGWSVERLSSWRVPDHLRSEDVALYGEPLFAEVVADGLGLALLEPTIDWLTQLGDSYRQRDVQFTTLGDARHRRESAFIKPANNKCFPAGVYESGDKLPTSDVLPSETAVLVAEPVHWEVEFRCFVLEHQAVTHTVYVCDGELAQSSDGDWSDARSHDAKQFAESILADEAVPLPPAVVLDVGIIEGRGWAVVELNAAWGSGLYGCDPTQALRVVQRACQSTHRISEADRQWIIKR